MSKKAVNTTVKKVVPKKTPEKETVHEADENKSNNFLENFNLEELTSDELKSKIENDEQYEEVFTKLNELFLGYSNDMTTLDEKRKKVIDLMKSIHAEFKNKQGTTNDEEEADGEDGEEEDGDEPEEIVTKPVAKPVVKKAVASTDKKPAVKKVTEPEEVHADAEETGDDEVEVPKKPVVKKGTVPVTGAKKVATASTVVKKPVVAAPVVGVKKATTATTAPTATTAAVATKKPAVKKTGK